MATEETTGREKEKTKCLKPAFRRYNIGPVKQKKNQRNIAIIFLSISLNMCFGYSKEPSHRDGSFEYPQHMYWLRSKKKHFFGTHSQLTPVKG